MIEFLFKIYVARVESTLKTHISMKRLCQVIIHLHTFRKIFSGILLPVAKQHDPFKYDDPSYTLPPRKTPSKDSSETCKCFLCGKYLSNQYNLRVHMETHEEAYHACQSCPHVSRSRDALRKHVSYRHPEEYHTRKRKKTDSL